MPLLFNPEVMLNEPLKCSSRLPEIDVATEVLVKLMLRYALSGGVAAASICEIVIGTFVAPILVEVPDCVPMIVFPFPVCPKLRIGVASALLVSNDPAKAATASAAVALRDKLLISMTQTPLYRMLAWW